MNPDRIEVSVDTQTLSLFIGGKLVDQWPVSTASKGVGFDEGSFRTPTGRFKVCEKIGAGADRDTCFRGRKPEDRWDGVACDHDLILSRILRLDGIDSANRNSLDRYIYIHGTNHEDLLGSPASWGCIRMSRKDIIQLFDKIDTGIDMIIHPPTEPRGKLIFFDCDSTLSTIEGIDELARAADTQTFKQVEALTHSAMNGEIPLNEVFPRRMEFLAPDRDLCDRIAQQYIDTLTPGVEELIERLREAGWTPVILSGGFAPLIQPLAEKLGIQHVEAVPLFHHDDGSYAGYGVDYPTTRNGGKPEIIESWKQALLPKAVVMIGDGISDLEASKQCDLFIGYGGVVEREPVKHSSDLWITDFRELAVERIDQAVRSSI